MAHDIAQIADKEYETKFLHFVNRTDELEKQLVIASEGKEVIAEGELEYDEEFEKYCIGGIEIDTNVINIFEKISKLEKGKYKVILEVQK